jgi:hypothetical protein
LKKFFNLPAFKKASWEFFEDNQAYLNAVCQALPIQGTFVPSQQGH